MAQKQLPNTALTSETELNFQATNTFFRQVRNLVFDTTDVRGTVTGIHWPSSQATLIQNCVFRLSSKTSDTHAGIFMEEGSGGMMADLVFHGGKYGARFGNQQYTMRNLTFYGSDTAIEQIWNWGWTYKTLKIVGCRVGINMSSSDVGSVTLLDSSFVNVSTALITGRTPGNTTGLGSLVIQNVEYKNVPIVLEGADGQPLLLGDKNGIVYDGGYARVSHTFNECEVPPLTAIRVTRMLRAAPSSLKAESLPSLNPRTSSSATATTSGRSHSTRTTPPPASSQHGTTMLWAMGRPMTLPPSTPSSGLRRTLHPSSF